jgi:hypothetical protein
MFWMKARLLLPIMLQGKNEKNLGYVKSIHLPSEQGKG